MTLTAPEPLQTQPQSRLRRVQPLLLLAGAVLAASVALHLRDPHVSGSWGFCPWALVTGTSCPGCGGLRAVNDLTHGDVMSAASSNLLFVASLPALAMLWLRSFSLRWQGVHRPLQRPVVTATAAVVVVLVVVFTVVRNLSFGAWLAP